MGVAMSVNPKIVIVGSGISGIAAAHRLVSGGFTNVRILEAAARSGGRIKTGRFGESRKGECSKNTQIWF